MNEKLKVMMYRIPDKYSELMIYHYKETNDSYDELIESLEFLLK